MDSSAYPHIEELARASHQIGKYRINATDILVRHKRAQRPSRKAAELELANLSQLIDACRFASKPPKWLPDFLVGRYGAYLLRRDQKGAIGLVRSRRGLEYNAVGWLEKETFTTTLVGDEPAEGQMRLSLSGHAVERYLERWAPATVEDGAESLLRLAQKGILSPDFPAWFDGQDHGGPYSFVIVCGEAMLPVAIEAHDRPRSLVAKTFLFRDMNSYRGRRLPEELRRGDS